MALAALLGLIAGPAAGVYLSKKVAKEDDTVFRAIEKTAGVNAALAVGGLLLSNYTRGMSAEFAGGVMIGSGVSAGVALGTRAITPDSVGKSKLGAPAVVKGLPAGYAHMAGHPAGAARVYR